jgi:hypothetical protein
LETLSGERMKITAGDLFVGKNKPTIQCPAIGYVVRIEYNSEFEEPEEIIIKWFGKFAIESGEHFYLRSQLNDYIHYPVKE